MAQDPSRARTHLVELGPLLLLRRPEPQLLREELLRQHPLLLLELLLRRDLLVQPACAGIARRVRRTKTFNIQPERNVP